uniref:Small G protein signaling modulator 2 n=1 Tax=Neogobius melanostomus TaxID=47308 RepID=A0A8C6SNL8_9GOBI
GCQAEAEAEASITGGVKQIMEESVTKKFVHEDSSHIIALCSAIEVCLAHMLKRRAAGFLRSDKTAALFTKVGKVYETAAEVCRKVQDQSVSSSHDALRRQGSTASARSPQPLSAQALRHIWVRTALFDKVLDKIIQHIVDNCSKYYEKEALMHDPVYGSILAALLVGPCALEYTKLKTSDHFWTDPSANELVQRHRIHGAHRSQETTQGRRPALGIRKRQSSGSMSEDRFAASAREYVESLHQNSRTHLLYGKNNVLVQPKKEMEVLRGYLSLHQSGETLTLKWTPNQLINGTLGDCDLEKSIYWDYALTVPLRQIVCLHCHQRPDCGGTLVLVSQDGIQRPPLLFPPGGHLLAFLSCLETGLLPRGQLEPPLWSQKGKGKVFPKLRKRSSAARLLDQDRPGDEKTAADYVFRIVYPGYRYDTLCYTYLQPLPFASCDIDWSMPLRCWDPAVCLPVVLSTLPSPLPLHQPDPCMDLRTAIPPLCVDFSLPPLLPLSYVFPLRCCSLRPSLTLSCVGFFGCSESTFCPLWFLCRVPLKMLCQNMKRQIVSRAFYGWLGYCRHLSTVRTHLSALVNHNMVPSDRPCEASGGLSKELWSKYQKDCKNYKELELLRLEVWPFLLGHYKFGMAKKDLSQSGHPQRRGHAPRHHHLHAAAAPRLAPEERPLLEFDSPDSGLPSSRNYSVTSAHSQILSSTEEEPGARRNRAPLLSARQAGHQRRQGGEDLSLAVVLHGARGGCTQRSGVWLRDNSVSCFSSQIELLDTVALNLHRIDKDVQRCDRNYYYFTTANLEKLRNIMCSYVWEHLEMGYVQGMCDLLAPLMVVLDDECLAYSCFTQLMKRMSQNFPNGGAMDSHFANMRSLIQILDSELFELMQQNGDYTHFYFCYRWFLLDFKRELLYEDVFAVWEVIWVAPRISSKHFGLFLALALVTVYREIIIHNNMDFTDIIKFFNEMAERHDVQNILKIARELVHKVQSLMDPK